MKPDAKILGDSQTEGGGRLVYDGRNEAWVDSKDTDPSAVRLGSPIGLDGGGGGKYNSDALLDPGNPDGPRIELGFIRITQNEYRRGHLDDFSAQIQIFLRDERIPEAPGGSTDPKYLPMLVGYAGDTKGHPALELHPTWVESLRRMLGGSAAPSGRVTRFYTDGGKFCINMQDGEDHGGAEAKVAAVIYRCLPTPTYPHINPLDESTWVAIRQAAL